MRPTLKRRSFLKGAGVAIALPMLEAMIPYGSASAPNTEPIKRFVCLSNNYGIYRDAFFPSADQTGHDYEIPETLKPLEKQIVHSITRTIRTSSTAWASPQTK